MGVTPVRGLRGHVHSPALRARAGAGWAVVRRFLSVATARTGRHLGEPGPPRRGGVVATQTHPPGLLGAGVRGPPGRGCTCRGFCVCSHDGALDSGGY